MSVFNIAADQPFLATLAEGVLARWGDNPLALAKLEILLPNRRSCRAFADILLAKSGKESLLLPRINPIGDAEEDEQPAILSTPRRHLLYSEKIAAWFAARGEPITRAAAFSWAEKLCALKDECERYRIPLDNLKNIFPEDVAAHRETLLSLLALGEDEGLTAEAARNQLLQQKAASLHGPIIAAGSLGTIPATADLLRAIAQLPDGFVILPGFDNLADIPPTHPQHHLQRLLKHIGASDIKNWQPNNTNTIQHFTRAWMRPDFHPQSLSLPQSIKLLQADTDFEEAEAIAIALRETLESENKTAILVTPDRKLARQVSALLKKWDVNVDDSAGHPLSHTPLGSLLLLILDAATAPQSPLALLPLLKHPLCQFSRQQARELEQNFFRKQRKPRGEFYEQIQNALQPLAALFAAPRASLTQLLSEHINMLEQFSGTPARPESPQLQSALAELLAAAENISVDTREYPGLFRQLFAHYTYRPAFGTHPRLSILSPMEARLMHADRIIISSLNDSAWPGKPSEDWLGKRLRAQLGLPQHTDAISHATHDFCQLLGAPEIILTRARYTDGTPQNAHPWLIRLQLLGTPREVPYLDWLKQRTLPAATPLQPPAPRPPLAARPTALSATDIRDLMQQPYRYYAHKILQLSPLDPLRGETMDKETGSAIHRAFEAYVNLAPHKKPHQTLEKLLQEYIRPILQHPAEWILWQARIPLIAAQFITWDEEERAHHPHIHAEQKGEAKIQIGEMQIALHAKADRIALNAANEAIISDYKTGRAPEKREITSGRQPQLLVEKWIMENGGYNSALSVLSTPRCTGLHYWRLNSNENRAERTPAPLPETGALAEELRSLLTLFYGKNISYFALPQDYRSNTDSYHHLIRMEEAFFR